MRYILIRFGIVFLIIDTVYDSSQITAACAEQAVQRFSVERGLNLFRIGVAYGSNRVGVNNAALKQIGIFISLQLIRRKKMTLADL